MAKIFQVLFCNANLVNRCVDLGGLNQLKTYSVDVGSFRYLMFDRYGMCFAARKLYVGSFKLSIGKEMRLEVPHNVEFLNFCNCRFGGKSLLDNVPSLRCAFELKEFVIVSCEGIESIISEGGDSKGLAGIQKLKLERLDDLIGLIREEEVHPYISFASLRRLEINKCGKVKKLWRLNTDLPNLEEVEVQSCEQMELVFVTERGATIKFPRLRSVVLCDLPELRSICDNGVFFLALVNLQVTNCNKVKKLGLKLSGNLNSLRDINVSLCNQLEELFQVVDRAEDDPIQFPSLEDLKLFDLPKLPCLEKLSLSDLPELSLRDLGEDFKFPQLHTLEVMNCPNVKKLTLLSHRLPSLTSLLVSGCQQIEQIFAEEDVEDITSLDIQWPNLKELRLLQLPELRSICKNTIVCDSLKLVELDDSSNGKLENFPISMPLLIDRGESYRLPVLKVCNVSKDWWLSLRWNSSATKVILHRLGCFTSEICHPFDLNLPDPGPCDLDLHL